MRNVKVFDQTDLKVKVKNGGSVDSENGFGLILVVTVILTSFIFNNICSFKYLPETMKRPV